MDNLFERVYRLVSCIPPGCVATYGQIALMLGNPRASRAVGFALHGCPSGRSIPCHRVVNRKGELSDVFLEAGEHRQRLLLEQEGVLFCLDGRVDLSVCLWNGMGC